MTPATRLAIGGLSAALAIAIEVIAVLAVSGGDDNGGPSAVAPGATAPATAPVAGAATATATLPATNPPAPPTATTAPPPPPPPPAPEPTPRSCAEIRADPVYRTDAEREFFLRNCGGPAPAPTLPGQPPPAPTSVVLTAAESTYISRASAVMGQYVSRLAQYWDTPSYGAYADLLELASIALNHANALNGLEPVPARFRAPHDRLRNSLLGLHDHIVYNLGFVRTLAEFLAWQASLDLL